MPDGSDVAAAIVVALPGHVMPPDAEPQTEAGFRKWVDSIHPVFVTDGLADKLIEEGFDTVDSVQELDEDDLRSDFDVRRGHARKFVAAARAVNLALGYTRAHPMGSVAPMAMAHRAKSDAPKVPVATSQSAGCGVGGLGTVQAFQA